MKLGLGTAQFGSIYGISNQSGQVTPAEVARILQFAASNNIQVLDTATSYGDSEKLIGASVSSVHNFAIVTKTLPMKTNQVRPQDLKKVEDAFDISLRNLRQSSVYGLLVHHSADLLICGGDRLYALLQRLKSEGLTRKIGVSVYDTDELHRLFEKYVFDIVQLPLNVFDQRFVRDGTLQQLLAEGVEIHARSAFLQGLLLMPTTALPQYFDSLKSHHSAYLAELKRVGISPLIGALGFFKFYPGVSTVLIGVESNAQLQECLASACGTPLLDYSGFAVNDIKVLDPRAWGK